jgi:bifunctional non-homologous end joining protein LigD
MPKTKRTPEENGPSKGRTHSFVVQKHLARSHFTIRLEMDGVLKSWTIPRGPSFDPTVKRMAIHIEDQPLEYGDFEGIVSGAGAVIVWDRGTWTELENPPYAYEKGKVVFDLRGFKMRGIWQLLKTKGEKDWLLIKKPDVYAAEDSAIQVAQESIISGLTVEELAAGKTKSGEIVADLEKINAPKKKVRAIDQSPMLAETAEEPFSRKGWIFELKYDGYRLIAARDHGVPRLLYRRGGDSTRVFPDICKAIDQLPYEHVVIDGEVVVVEDDARPSFQRLQKRVQLSRTQDIERASLDHPATLFAFDLLAFGDYDLRGVPLLVRKLLLKKLLPKHGPLRFCDHVEERGLELFRQVEKMQLEGIVAKKADSIYRAGRSADWLKVRVDQTGDFAVVGYAVPKDEFRTGFTALHLAYYEDGKYIYNGRVGGGFAEKELRDLSARLEELVVSEQMFEGTPIGKGHVWVRPEMVVEVRYKEITHDQLLRQPVFLRLRDDKRPQECVREVVHNVEAPEEEEAVELGSSTEVKLTNLDKIFWPEDELTKGDLIEYYRTIAPWLLPYLKDRPLVLTRYPDGIHGKNFYQKDAPGHVPEWIRTEKLLGDEGTREIDFFICDDLDSLLFLANLATIPLHVWASRMAAIEKPDWCIIDLDPKKAPFSSVKTIALALRELCEEIALPSFVKTSGSTGLHVMLPLGGQCTHEQSRGLGELISRVITEQLPKISTIARQIEARGDKVYLDYLQNGRGKTIVSPLCVRPLAKAPVSMILHWNEVENLKSPQQFTIRDAAARMRAMTVDPMLAVLETKVKLPVILKNLEKRMRR